MIQSQGRIDRRNMLLGGGAGIAAAGLAGPAGAQPQPAQPPTAAAAGAPPPAIADPARRTIERRAVEAAIWGMPIVSVDAMRQAFFRADARYGDVLYLSKPADWRFQTTTPNASSLYVYLNFNTKDGPVVLDFPAAVGAGLFGSVLDAWSLPVADVGPDGEDQGRGGKYLLLPPGHQGGVPDGHSPLRFDTYNGYALFRAIPATTSAADLEKAIGLVKQMRLYPLAQAGNPPPSRHIDIAGQLFDGIVRMDDSFYDSLARMVDEEPVQTQDLVAMAQLRSLGIEKGKAFDPDQPTRAILRNAAAEAHAGFIRSASTIAEPWWPGTRWGLTDSVGPRTDFSYRTGDRLDIDQRGATFFLAYAVPKKLGAATFYAGAFTDAQGQPLLGEKTYRLHVPPNVPARQYWAVTVYDVQSAAFIREAPTVAIDSYQNTQKNADGSVDVHFGPKAPPGRESNWIYTAPGRAWFTFFRFYGPERAVFEKTWALPDIEEVK
jgi:hypothetical protein